jgi:hypothetical protein
MDASNDISETGGQVLVAPETIIDIVSENVVEPAGEVESDVDERATCVLPESGGENPTEAANFDKSDEQDGCKVTESAVEIQTEPVNIEKLGERDASEFTESAGENPATPEVEKNDGIKSAEFAVGGVSESASENPATAEVQKNDSKKTAECAVSRVSESAGENPVIFAKITPSKMVLPRQPCGPTPGSTTPLKQQKISSYFSSPSGVTVPVVCKPVIRSINFEKTEIGNIPGGVSPSGKTSETLASVGSKGNYF